MPRKLQAEPYLNQKRLGMLMETMRTEAGYKSVKELLDAMEEETGYRVSQSVYYKFEQGRGVPGVDLWAAFQLTVREDGVIDWVLERCLPSEEDDPLYLV